MKRKTVKRLRKLIKSPGYYALRWTIMRKEGDMFYQDWLLSKNNEDIKTCTRCDNKANWYSKKIGQ